MARVTEDQVLAALRRLRDPRSGRDLVGADMVQSLAVKDGNVQFVLEVDPADGPKLEPLRQEAERVVLALPGVTSATAILTAHRGGRPKPPTHREHTAQGHGHDHGHDHDHGHGHGHGHGHDPARGQGQGQRPPLPGAGKTALPGIRSVVAVASGKGGVGKSTTAANLALALQAQGLKVGLLDADIYGPSQPRLMGLGGRPDSPDGKIIIPHKVNGLPVMSIGFLVAEDTAMIWRGPMVQSALMQMLRDVQWGELDVLVVDLPPGTGDAQLTMAQQVPLTGAVIVSTPQDIALLDVKKAIAMFRKVDVPILGLVENMSVFVCPNCGHESHVFSHGGAHKEADRQGIRFLGEVPLDLKIRETSDAGKPIVLHFPDSPQAEGYRAIARQVWAATEAQLAGGTRQGPKITMQ